WWPAPRATHCTRGKSSTTGGERPAKIVTGTASYGGIVFGPAQPHRARVRAPQLADLPDRQVWRIDRTADCGASQNVARGRVGLARIDRHWEDSLRIVGSVHTGAVRAYDAIRMPWRDGRPTPPRRRDRHYGRTIKTPHILRLADELGCRRRIKVQANLHKGHRSLAPNVL
ncbi:transposase, partial [Streptomyces sp. TRM76130]|nr:transposase [Streptomyces sp. TRM76130]